MATDLQWGSDLIRLDDNADVGALMAEIRHAVRSGGGWVTVQTGVRSISIFFSAGQYFYLAGDLGDS
jgi:hypothetical protein